MKPTPEQMAIYDSLAGTGFPRSKYSLAINSVAGSGKTTTAVTGAGYASRLHKNIGFVAFNAAIAKELGSRMKGTASASTLHSLGLRLLRPAIPGLGLCNENSKYRTIAVSEYPSFFVPWKGRMVLRPEYAALLPMIDVIRTQNIDIHTVSEKSIEGISDACDRQGIEVPSVQYIQEVVYAAMRCLEIGSDLSVMTEFDFSDMIWLPGQLGLNKRFLDLIFADEAQDFNPTQQHLINSVANESCIVGDPYQSIMGWAGADNNSFSNLAKLTDARELPLSVCWRCPSRHLGLARILVPHIKDSPECREGTVRQVSSFSVASFCKPGDMILCRNNSPLISCAYNMMRQKVRVCVKGKNIGQGIVKLIERLKACDTADLAKKLARYELKELGKLVDRDAHETAFDALRDKVRCIVEISKECDSIASLNEMCHTLFTDASASGEVVTLSSIHRAKGLEADNVVILEPELLAARARDPESYQQEKNLLYVALTRAKNHLAFASGEGGGVQIGEWLQSIAGRSMPLPKKSKFGS